MKTRAWRVVFVAVTVSWLTGCRQPPTRPGARPGSHPTEPAIITSSWTCTTPGVRKDLLPVWPVGKTVLVRDQIGTTNVHVIPMLVTHHKKPKRPECAYSYTNPTMAAACHSENFYTAFYIFCREDLPHFDWGGSTLVLADGTALSVLAEAPLFVGGHPHKPLWEEGRAFLLFPSLPQNVTEVTLNIPYSREGKKAKLTYEFSLTREDQKDTPLKKTEGKQEDSPVSLWCKAIPAVG